MLTTTRRTSALLVALSLILAIVGVTSPAAEAQGTAPSFFSLNGTAGDYITQGQDVTYEEGPDVTFTPSVNFDNGISIMVDVWDSGSFVARWHADFAAPNDVPLAAGDSFSATRFPFQEADSAGQSIHGAGRGCNMLTGTFTVGSLVMAGGEVETFTADFTQSCDGGPVMSGSVGINPAVAGDTTPPDAHAGLDQTGRIKGTSSSFFVEAWCTDNEPGVELVSAEINGISVDDGQKVKLVISNREKVTNRKGKLTIQSASIELVVTCMDSAGNQATATVTPLY